MEGCDSGVGLGGATAWSNLRRLRSATQLNVGTRRVSEGVRGPIRSFMAPALRTPLQQSVRAQYRTSLRNNPESMLLRQASASGRPLCSQRIAEFIGITRLHQEPPKEPTVTVKKDAG